MMRHLIGSLALVAVASVAGAQQTTPAQTGTHGDSASAMHRSSHAGAKHKGTMTGQAKGHAKSSMHDSTKAKHATTSGGEVSLDAGGPGYATHAVSRDFVGADDSHCDALCQRERKMDAMCGKDREKCGKRY